MVQPLSRLYPSGHTIQRNYDKQKRPHPCRDESVTPVVPPCLPCLSAASKAAVAKPLTHSQSGDGIAPVTLSVRSHLLSPRRGPFNGRLGGELHRGFPGCDSQSVVTRPCQVPPDYFSPSLPFTFER